MTAGFEPAMTVLQTGALPLGYRTILNFSDSNGNRTRVTAVKGRCLNRLTMEPVNFSLGRFALGLSPSAPGSLSGSPFLTPKLKKLPK